MATLHIKGQVCQYVYTGTANCASIPFVGIVVPLNLYGIMQQIYMWQSQVEIKHYSVAYFNRIIAFEVL